MTLVSIFGLDPATHRPHPLHSAERTYVETNCFVDCLVELVAAAGHEPVAMLGGAAAVDFEIDQWAFLKPGEEDLRVLYGMQVHEVQPYRSDLAAQLVAWLEAGSTLLPEVDAFHLPDTATTSYRTEHVKTSIAVEAVDLDARVLRYFHNASYHELSGEDFDAVLRRRPQDRDLLLPYVDGVRWVPGTALVGDALRAAALDLLGTHLARRPADNPFERFGTQLRADLPGLLEGDLAAYHHYAFATARMAGAAFELLATHVRWLCGPDGETVATRLDDIVGGTKMLLFRLARRRAFDTDALVTPMVAAWAGAMSDLDDLVSA